MSRSRIQSAGPLVGPEQEVRMLRNTVTKLQQDLLQSKAETQKTVEQLNCLMLLVKRAWSGDESAAINVANIVGVAPPDFEVDSDGFKTTLSSKPKHDETTIEPPKVFLRSKSRAVSNWAVLTIGLLNRDYKKLEQQEEMRAKYYLKQRQDYLDHQLLLNRDSQFRNDVLHRQETEAEVNQLKNMHQASGTINTNGFNTTNSGHVPLKRVNSLTDLSRNRTSSFSEDIVGNKAFITQSKADSRPTSCKTRAPARHLYRPANQKQQETIDLTWADLVIEPNSHQERHVDHSVGHVEENGHVGKQKYRYKRSGYDDSKRYNVNGLYDAENALGPGSSVFRKRPPSAKVQRQSDNMRSRPKSAIYVKNERSLKYETTRPVSAIVTSKSNRPPSGKKQQQHPQAKTTTTPSRPSNTPIPHNMKNGSSSQENEQPYINDDEIYEEDDFDVEEVVYDDNAFKKLGIDMKEVDRELKQVQQIRVNITKPKSVVQFEEDVKHMHDMEKVIRNTAKELQKKLGLCEEGIV